MRNLKSFTFVPVIFAILKHFPLFYFSPTVSDLSQSFKVENIIVHPDYVPDHPSNQHDLAVIKIREEEISKSGEGKDIF